MSTKGELLAEAKRLERIQISERGDSFNDQKPRQKIRGPYVSTPEREARAARIVQLRRQAARMS